MLYFQLPLFFSLLAMLFHVDHASNLIESGDGLVLICSVNRRSISSKKLYLIVDWYLYGWIDHCVQSVLTFYLIEIYHCSLLLLSILILNCQNVYKLWHSNSHIKKIEDYINKKFHQTALDHLKKQIMTKVTEEFKHHNKPVHLSVTIPLLKSHIQSLESEVQFLRED